MPRSHRYSFAPTITHLEDRSTPAAIGSIDPGFGTAGKAVLNLGPSDSLNAVAVQLDGKIVAAGTNSSDNGDFLVVRLNPNGTLDTTFGTNGIRYLAFDGHDVATGVSLMPDGRIVVGGYTEKAGSSDFAVARLLSNGLDDPTFGTNGRRQFDLGKSLPDRAYAVAVNQFGGTYLAGSQNGNIAISRLDGFGNLDKAYGTNGIAVFDLGGTEQVRSMALYSDGTAILAGFTDAAAPATPTPKPNDFFAVRVASNASSLDFGFGTVVLAGNKAAIVDFSGDDKAYAVSLLPDGKILFAGTNGGPTADFALARVNPNGTLDTTFNGGGTRRIGFGGIDEARALTMQADGKIVVAGFVIPDGQTNADFAVTRLNANGTDDSTFGGTRRIDFGGDDRALAVALDQAGRVVLAGQTAADSASSRVIGTVGLPNLLLVSGTADASALQFTTSGGIYTSGSPFTVFPGFTGAIRTAVVDITGDGVADRIAGVGPGGGPQVTIFDGKTGGLIANFFAFESTFTGGVLLSGGDFNGDGRAELVVTADVGGGPRVRVFDGKALLSNTTSVLVDFFGIEDTAFRGGARPAVGDVNNDGTPDLIVAAGPGGGPRIAVFNGKDVATSQPVPSRLLGDFYAYDPALRNGAYVTSGDVNGDGHDDLVFGAGLGGSPHVRVISGKQLMAAGPFTNVDNVVGLQLAGFFAGNVDTRGGVMVTVKDFDADGLADVITGSGAGQKSEVRVFKGSTLSANPTNPTADQILDPFASAVISGGVFVG